MSAEKSEKIELSVKNASGKEVSTHVAGHSVFVPKVKENLLHASVRWQRAKRRSGTHSVLTRGAASGGGIKPWKQKGTGRARAGSNTSPIWVGGGVAHGPKPRSYEHSLNKSQRRLALRSAITVRLQEGRLTLIEDFGIKKGKTKEAQAVLTKLGVGRGEKALVAVTGDDTLTMRALRNIDGVKVISSDGLNVYDVLVARHLVMTTAAFSAIESRLSKGERA